MTDTNCGIVSKRTDISSVLSPFGGHDPIIPLVIDNRSFANPLAFRSLSLRRTGTAHSGPVSSQTRDHVLQPRRHFAAQRPLPPGFQRPTDRPSAHGAPCSANQKLVGPRRRRRRGRREFGYCVVVGRRRDGRRSRACTQNATQSSARRKRVC